jgi:hypothetical protein
LLKGNGKLRRGGGWSNLLSREKSRLFLEVLDKSLAIHKVVFARGNTKLGING